MITWQQHSEHTRSPDVGLLKVTITCQYAPRLHARMLYQYLSLYLVAKLISVERDRSFTALLCEFFSMIEAVLWARSSGCLVIVHNGTIECNLGE